MHFKMGVKTMNTGIVFRTFGAVVTESISLMSDLITRQFDLRREDSLANSVNEMCRTDMAKLTVLDQTAFFGEVLVTVVAGESRLIGQMSKPVTKTFSTLVTNIGSIIGSTCYPGRDQNNLQLDIGSH